MHWTDCLQILIDKFYSQLDVQFGQSVFETYLRSELQVCDQYKTNHDQSYLRNFTPEFNGYKIILYK